MVGGEAGRMLCPGCGQGFGAFLRHLSGMPEVDVRRSVKPDARVLMIVVISVHEITHKDPGLTQGSEALGKQRPVFQGLEGALRVRVVVAYPGT